MQTAVAGGEGVYRGPIYWFFRRKLKIGFLSFMIYAALC